MPLRLSCSAVYISPSADSRRVVSFQGRNSSVKLPPEGVLSG